MLYSGAGGLWKTPGLSSPSHRPSRFVRYCQYDPPPAASSAAEGANLNPPRPAWIDPPTRHQPPTRPPMDAGDPERRLAAARRLLPLPVRVFDRLLAQLKAHESIPPIVSLLTAAVLPESEPWGGGRPIDSFLSRVCVWAFACRWPPNHASTFPFSLGRSIDRLGALAPHAQSRLID